MPAAPTAVLAGLVLGASLLVSFGAQNVFVLRQGALRAHIGVVVAICTASDLVLIAAGIAGTGALLAGRPALLDGVRVAGASLLVAFAVLAARRAVRPPGADEGSRPVRWSLGAVTGACLGFTWLNPAVYLDTVLLLGSVADSHPGHRWWFGAGAALASAAWFAGLGFGARLLAPLLERPGAWRVLDGLVAVAMLVTAGRLLAGG